MPEAHPMATLPTGWEAMSMKSRSNSSALSSSSSEDPSPDSPASSSTKAHRLPGCLGLHAGQLGMSWAVCAVPGCGRQISW